MTPSNDRTVTSPTDLAPAYLETLLAGDRAACRTLLDEALAGGAFAYDLLTQLVWPTMEMLQQLYRDDRISISSLNLATRLNRQTTDQL
jgi:methanogenic corrinoid protein MtbC1